MYTKRSRGGHGHGQREMSTEYTEYDSGEDSRVGEPPYDEVGDDEFLSDATEDRFVGDTYHDDSDVKGNPAIVFTSTSRVDRVIESPGEVTPDFIDTVRGWWDAGRGKLVPSDLAIMCITARNMTTADLNLLFPDGFGVILTLTLKNIVCPSGVKQIHTAGARKRIVTQKEKNYVPDILRRGSLVKDIRLDNCYNVADADFYSALIAMERTFPVIDTLEIDDKGIPFNSWTILTGMCKLAFLRIDNVDLTERTSPTDSPISFSPGLLKVQLYSISGTYEQLAEVVDKIAVIPGIGDVSLVGIAPAWDPAHEFRLCDAIEKLARKNSLRRLNLSGSRLTERMLTSLGSGAAARVPADYVPVAETDESVSELSGFGALPLPSSDTFRQEQMSYIAFDLYMTSCGLGKFARDALIRLVDTDQLKVLDLADNPIGGALAPVNGAPSPLLTAIAGSRNLSQVSFSRCALAAEIVESILSVLGPLHKISYIRLDGNELRRVAMFLAETYVDARPKEVSPPPPTSRTNRRKKNQPPVTETPVASAPLSVRFFTHAQMAALTDPELVAVLKKIQME